jgi:hypothetical protein
MELYTCFRFGHLGDVFTSCPDTELRNYISNGDAIDTRIPRQTAYNYHIVLLSCRTIGIMLLVQELQNVSSRPAHHSYGHRNPISPSYS